MKNVNDKQGVERFLCDKVWFQQPTDFDKSKEKLLKHECTWDINHPLPHKCICGAVFND